MDVIPILYLQHDAASQAAADIGECTVVNMPSRRHLSSSMT